MKENVKNTTKALYTMCICLIVVMGVLFLGNSLTKGTYSAGTVLTKNTNYCSKSGYVLNGNKCCPSGYGLYNGGVSCCPSGYSWSSGDSICVNSSGKQISPTAAVAASTCKAGNILNGNTCTANSSSSSSSSSSSCPPGQYYFDQSSQPLKCETCRPGTYCPGGTEAAVACEPGYYCPESGLSAQVKCPPDKPNSNGYSKSINDCYATTKPAADGQCYINTAFNKYEWKTTTPGSGYTLASGITQSNCIGCAKGYVENNEGDCVVSSDSDREYACYTRNDTNGTRVWTNNPSSTWTKNNITSANSCKDCYKCIKNGEVSYYLGIISNDNCFFYSHSNTSSSCPGGSTGDGDIPDPPIPDPPSTSSTPTNPPTSTPSSNVDENPKTGSIAIFMVWVIAIGTLIYSIAYFKQSKFE